MRLYIVGYVAAAVCMLAFDIVWLSSTAQTIYRPALGDLLRPDVNVPPAILFYLLYVAGIVFFGVLPALKAGDWTTAALNGAVLGLVAYGTYDLTNQATLVKWSTTITILDLCWGTLLTALSATAGFFGAKYFGGIAAG
jgi:uncharacterized membrane protein